MRTEDRLFDKRMGEVRNGDQKEFIFRNTLWPSGRFLRGFFFKNYLGWRGPKISLKLSSGAQSENLEPSLTIREFFSKNIPGFICGVCVPFLGS